MTQIPGIESNLLKLENAVSLTDTAFSLYRRTGKKARTITYLEQRRWEQ